MTAVQFKVPEVEHLAVRALVQRDYGITARVWVEILLTRLCAPHLEHPACARAGVSADALIQATRLTHPAGREDYVKFDAPWIPAMDPSLKLAELELPAFLSTLWHWNYSKDGRIVGSLAARLAAFASRYDGMQEGVKWRGIAFDKLSATWDPRSFLASPAEGQHRPLPWFPKGKAT